MSGRPYFRVVMDIASPFDLPDSLREPTTEVYIDLGEGHSPKLLKLAMQSRLPLPQFLEEVLGNEIARLFCEAEARDEKRRIMESL